MSQTLSLIENYEKSNLSLDYRYKFLVDAIRRLQAGKTLTTRQRSWLDSLIEEGAPEIKRDNMLIEKIREAMELRGMEHRASVLRDFVNRLSCGRELSPKQTTFLSGMLKEADDIRERGPYEPTDSEKIRLSQCVMLGEGYSSMYWQTHPGTARALRAVREWIEGNSESIDEWSANKITSAMASKLRELNESPYASSGDLVWVKIEDTMITGVVSGTPEVCERGEIKYPVLTGSELLMLTKARLAKRKTR